LGITLGVLGNQIIQKHEVRVEKVETENQQEVMALFGTMPEERTGSKSAKRWFSYGSSSHAAGMLSSEGSRSLGTTLCGGGSWHWQRFAWLCLAVLGLTSFVAIRSSWSVTNTVYHLIVTSCTIGYGDLVPKTQMERLAAVIYIPMVCLLMGHWLAYIANTIIELQSSQFIKKRLEHPTLTQASLDIMDVNGDGKVCWAEFLEFMLVTMEKVDYELIEELQSYFRQLDVAETGELSRDDLVEAARRKLKSARHKLELATYKRRVVNLGKFGRTKRRSSLARRMTTFSNVLGMTFRNFNLFDTEEDTKHGDERIRLMRGGSSRIQDEGKCRAQQARESFLTTRNTTRTPQQRHSRSVSTYRTNARRVSFLSDSRLVPEESSTNNNNLVSYDKMIDGQDDEESNHIQATASTEKDFSSPSPMACRQDYPNQRAPRRSHQMNSSDTPRGIERGGIADETTPLSNIDGDSPMPSAIDYQHRIYQHRIARRQYDPPQNGAAFTATATSTRTTTKKNNDTNGGSISTMYKHVMP
jgi:hypothetical protein